LRSPAYGSSGRRPAGNVEFEALNGRYTIFDKRHSPEDTFRTAEARKLSEGLLASTAERVVEILQDVAPSLPEKLHSALKAFEGATTADELAHVALSCRRIIEYVSNCIFPPQDKPSPDGRKLDRSAYKNRLLAFADNERRSDTSIDLIIASTEMLSEQWGRLTEAVNKGLHADMIEPEVRRCLVRTILLLDDVIGLKAGPFTVKPELDIEMMMPSQRRKTKGDKSPRKRR
jgi:hypothetical protein